MENTSGQGRSASIPDGVKGWSWGALFLNWIWAIGNRTWIGLFAFVPCVGVVVAIVLGIKGREWAWQNRRWQSVGRFRKVQRKWDYWGLGIVLLTALAGLLAALILPAMLVNYRVGTSANASEQINRWASRDSGRDSFSLSELELSASWTELHVFPPYTSASTIQERLGRKWEGAIFHELEKRDDINLAVFLLGPRSYSAETWLRQEFDCASSITSEVLSPDTVIQIDRTGEVPVLSIADDNEDVALP